MVNFNEDLSKNYKKLANKILGTALKYTKIKFTKINVDISFVNEEDIKKLNKEHRKIDKVTDVLSFPMLQLKPFEVFDRKKYFQHINPKTKHVFLGDIVLCRPIIEKNAEEYGHSYERELFYMIVHGIMHLLGYDHEDEDNKRLMRAAEEAILNKYKIRQ